MGWADCGIDSNGRPIGYAFEAICDHPDCDEKIHRGLAYACGPTHGEGSYYCEKYFCYEHLYHVEGERSSICAECVTLFQEEDSMFGRKEKKELVRVYITFKDHEGQTFEERICIPEGFRFKRGEFGADKMFNSEGLVVNVYTWRAGYSKKYEFIYAD